MIGSDRPSPCVLLSQPAIRAELTCHPRNSQLCSDFARLTGRRAGRLQRRVGMHFKQLQMLQVGVSKTVKHRASVKIRVILAQLAEAEGVRALLFGTTACDTAALL
jgi:hypothetical protein